MNKIFGQFKTPPGASAQTAGLGGVMDIVVFAFRGLILGAGLYALFNFIFAGYGYLSAGNDPKKIQESTSKLWYSIIGLTVSAGSLALAGLLGRFLFSDPGALTRIIIYGPN